MSELLQILQKDLEKQTLALQKFKAEIPDTSFKARTIFGQTPLDDYEKCHNNRQYSWKNVGCQIF